MSAQHLRPLFAFVVVAIVGAVVFGNALRAQDVVNTIRNGTSSVLAGTPVLHEPLYVVEDGVTLEATEPKVEPKAQPTTVSSSQPDSPVAEAASGAGVTPVPLPAAGTDPVSPPTSQPVPHGDRAGSDSGTSQGGDSPGTPKAPSPSKGHGPDQAQPAGGSGGPGASDGHHGNGRGEGHSQGGHHGKGVVSARVGEDHEGHGNGRDGSRPGQAKGHDTSDHDHAKGHTKSHTKGHTKGHDKGTARGHR